MQTTSLSFKSSSHVAAYRGQGGVEDRRIGEQAEKRRRRRRRRRLDTPTYRPKTVSFIKNVKITHTHIIKAQQMAQTATAAASTTLIWGRYI